MQSIAETEMKVSGTLYKVADAASELTIAEKTLRNWIAAGRVTIVRLGGYCIRVPQSEIDRMISEGVRPSRA